MPPPPKESKVAVFSTLFTLLVFLAQFPAKIACAIMTLLSPAIRGSLCYVLATIFAASIFNLWLWKLIKHKEHLSGNRYGCSKLINSPPFWLFLLDQFVFFIPFLLLLFPVVLTTNLIIGLIFLICNLASFFAIVCVDTSFLHEATSPGLDEKYILVDAREVAGLPDNQLSVVQSDAYCIVISNIGTKPVQGNIKIIRMVTTDPFDVAFTLAAPLLPGFQLKLVPEGRETEGAVALKGYLSFGTNRGRTIETKIFVDGNTVPTVTKTETYELPASAIKEYLDKQQTEAKNP